MSTYFSKGIKFPKFKGIYLFYNFVIYYSFTSNWISSFKCHQFCFLCSVIISFNSYAARCKLSSVSDITTWSSASNSVNSCWFFGSGFPYMSSFCHLVLISSKYTVRNVDDRGQPYRTPLLISASFDGLKLKFYQYFVVCVYAHYCLISKSLKYKIKSISVYYQMLFDNQ
jgi:hypothetical protein